MIVELCGLPGCGKSTIVDKYSNTNNIITRKDIFEKPTITFKFLYKIVCFSYFKFNFLKSTRIIKKFASQFQDVEDKYIHKILQMYCFIKLAKRRNNYLLDEGPLQYITSVTLKNKIELNSSLSKLLSLFYKKNIMTIKCNIDINIAYDRIIKRNKKNDRYILEKNKAIDLLLQKQENINFLYSCLNTIKQEYNILNDDNELIIELNGILR